MVHATHFSCFAWLASHCITPFLSSWPWCVFPWPSQFQGFPMTRGMNAFMYFGPRIFHSLHLNAPGHETGQYRGCQRWINIETGVLTTGLAQRNAWLILHSVGRRSGRGTRFCSFSVVVNGQFSTSYELFVCLISHVSWCSPQSSNQDNSKKTLI